MRALDSSHAGECRELKMLVVGMLPFWSLAYN